jgi:hypothetical protein
VGAVTTPVVVPDVLTMEIGLEVLKLQVEELVVEVPVLVR